jgi:hypothetical protein
MIIGIARSKNNQTIVEPFVRHHLKLLDYLLICDNGSVDATKEILERLAAENSRLVLYRDDNFGDFQTQHYVNLMHYAESYRPSYIVTLDADEFLGVENRSALEALLGRIPLGGLGMVYWRTFVITPETISACAQDAPRGFCWRRRSESPQIGKAIIRCEGAPVKNFVLEPGNHGAVYSSGRRMPSIEFGDDLPLLHFPITCREQLLAKTVIHWMAFLVRDAKARQTGDDGWQSMRNFDRIIKANGEISDAELCEMSLMYAQDLYQQGVRPELMQDAHGIQYERKYSTGESMAAIPLIAKTWEQSLTGAR